MEQVALLWNLHPWSDSRIAWERPQQPQLTSKLHLQRRKLCRDWLGPDNFPSHPNLFHDLISLSTPRSGFQNLGTEKGRLCCGKGRHLFCHRPQKKGIGWAREKQLQQHTQNSFSFLMLALCCSPLEKDWNHKLHHSNFTSSNSIFLESATTCSVSHGPPYKLKNLYSWRSRNIQDLLYSTHNPSQWRQHFKKLLTFENRLLPVKCLACATAISWRLLHFLFAPSESQFDIFFLKISSYLLK